MKLKEKANIILDEFKSKPRMYASSNEAFISGVASVIMMASDNPLEFDCNSFYGKHLFGGKLKSLRERLDNLTYMPTEEWAELVVDDAKSIIDKF